MTDNVRYINQGEYDYRVWHIPQVPGKPFQVEVTDGTTAKLILDVLAQYDAFQFEHNIKPDYCNAQGVEVIVDGEWCNIDDDELEEQVEDERKAEAAAQMYWSEQP